MTYYNDIDPLKAEVLREAIKAGAIAPGDVDERSIKDIEPADLVEYTQCHFFAGGGFWGLALRSAGWPDDRPVWTGSCPCPSFSAAGKGGGFDDPRHLWPDWFKLIGECRPPVIFGEQADDAVGFGWLDLVQTDLEAKAYAVGKVVFGAHSVGAPHIRQRLYFCANAVSEQNHTAATWGFHAQPQERIPDGDGAAGVGIYTDSNGSFAGRETGATVGYRSAVDSTGSTGIFGGGEHPFGEGPQGHFGDVREWRGPGWLDPLTARSIAEAGATRGFWADCDWWYGRDDKYRPIGPGLFPLAHGSTARVGRLCMFGDAIVVTQAQAFIETFMQIAA